MKLRQSSWLLFLFILLLRVETGHAQHILQETYPGSSFTNMVEAVAVPGDPNRLYVVSQGGQIMWVPGSPAENAQPQIFLDIISRVVSGGERGLLGLAFHPQFETNGFFYVNYTAGNPLETRISRFSRSQTDPALADPTSEVVLLTYQQPFDNHNGGKIAFGPDGFLYISSGDGGGSGDPLNNGQNRASLLGKILRVDVNATAGDRAYGIPAENPFVGNTTGYREEIYAYGLRNPWKFSFDRETGRLWAADVGQSQREEINIIEAGGNYGWRIMEGTGCHNPTENCETEGLKLPIFEYNQNQGAGRSITGGFVYRGSRLPELVGKYIYGDYLSGNIWALSVNENGTAGENTLLLNAGFLVSGFAEDHDRELLVLSYGTDRKLYTLSSSVTGLSKNSIGSFTLYPNPTRSGMVVRLEQGVAGPDTSLRLFNVLGQEVMVTALRTGEKEAHLDVSKLAKGVYTLRVRTGTAEGWKRVLVE